MHANPERDGQCIACICICHLFKKLIINPSGFVQEWKEIQTTRCISRTSQKRWAYQEARGRKKIPKGFAVSGLEASVSFPFCRQDNKCLRAKSICSSPCSFFLSNTSLKRDQLSSPLILAVTQGLFYPGSTPCDFFFFFASQPFQSQS